MKLKYVFIITLSSSFLWSQEPPLIFIEGNIGAGKSTFVNILQQHLSSFFSLSSTQDIHPVNSVVMSLEPCDEWQNIEGHNLLQAFYADTSRWALLFQIYASMTRIRKQQRDAIGVKVFHIMERSWFSDRYCFAQMLYENSKINDLEWAVYEQMWNWYMRNSNLPLCFIYLQVSPEICYQRLQSRNRSEEVGVSLAYLQDLHEHHERLLIDKTAATFLRNIPVLVIDGTLNFRDDKDVQQIFIRQILDFLKIHGNIDLTM